MKILQINSVYKIASTGRTCLELCTELEKNNYNKVLTACKNSYIDSEHTIQIGNIIDYKIHALLSRITGKPGYYSKKNTKKFLKKLDEIRPDIVHLRNLHSNYINIPMLLKYLGDNDVATVITLHDCFLFTGKCVHPFMTKCERYKQQCGNCQQLHSDNKSWFFDRTKQMLEDKKEYLLNIPRLAVVGVSKWVIDQTNNSILEKKVIRTTIYNWIDDTIFKPCNYTDVKIKINMELPIILGVASHWEPSKGYDEFCIIAKEMKGIANVILVGDIPNNRKIPEIYYYGIEKNPKKLAKLYSMATVFFNPTKIETFGKVSAEAMACGTPVVAYDVTANKEIIGANCGYVVELGNFTKIIEALKKVIEDGKQKYSVTCIKYVKENFNMKKNIQKYLDIYKELEKMKEDNNV